MKKVVSIILAVILTMGVFYQPAFADKLSEDTGQDIVVQSGEEKAVREMKVKPFMDGFTQFPYGEISQYWKSFGNVVSESYLYITYEDGTEVKLQAYQWEENFVSVYVKNKDTGEIFKGEAQAGQPENLPVGNYELYAQCGGAEIMMKEFSVLGIKEFYQGDLLVSGTVEIKPVKSTYLSFKFVTEKPGNYRFIQTIGNGGGTYAVSSLLDSQGNEVANNQIGTSHQSQWTVEELPAGEYWLLVPYYSHYNGITITAEEIVHEIADLQTGGKLLHDGVIPAGEIYHTAKSWNSSASQGLYVNFIYTDGAVGKNLYSFEWEDVGIEGVLKDQQGNLVEDQGYSKTLPVGKYQLYAKYRDITTHVTDFEVKPPSECFDEVLNLDHPVKFDKVLYRNRVVKMEIEKAGTYTLSSEDVSWETRHISIRDREGKFLKSIDLSQESPVTIYLEPNEYYLCFRGPEISALSLKEGQPEKKKIEVSGTSSYQQIFPEREILKNKNSWNIIMRGFQVRLFYANGMKSEPINPDQYEKNGLRIEIKDNKTGEKISISESSQEPLPKGSYEALLIWGDVSEKVMDFEVKSQEECAGYTLSLTQPLVYNRVRDQVLIAKFMAEEDGVYFFHCSPEDLYYQIKNEEGRLIKVNASKELRIYLPKGTYYLYFKQGGSFEISVDKKSLTDIEVIDIPSEEQRIFRQDEIDSLWEVIAAKSRMHQGIKFCLTYKDGSQEVIGYKEFLDLVWNVTVGNKNGRFNIDGNDIGSYLEYFVLPGANAPIVTPTSKMKFWVYKGFDDVSEADWYLNYAARISAEGIMTGLNETTFGGTVTLRRSHVATILYRLAGNEDIEFENKFPDVGPGDFYSLPVTWCNKNGIVTGYSNGYFGPDDDITREQLALMLYRYAESQGYDVSDHGELKDFPDEASVSDFAREAMEWAVGAGMIKGNNGNLLPQGGAARAEAAAMILRFMDKYDL